MVGYPGHPITQLGPPNHETPRNRFPRPPRPVCPKAGASGGGSSTFPPPARSEPASFTHSSSGNREPRVCRTIPRAPVLLIRPFWPSRVPPGEPTLKRQLRLPLLSCLQSSPRQSSAQVPPYMLDTPRRTYPSSVPQHPLESRGQLLPVHASLAPPVRTIHPAARGRRANPI